MIQHIINVAESFIASLGAFVIWTHFDFEGWWEQHHIRNGRRKERKASDSNATH